ncbi:MAG: laccase domain-containing protein [Deltaproteobacteria bacterium]|nr:laccase domain-containing protein [Deltaproteobacteria bacterium]
MAGLVHGFFSRQGGVSPPPFDGLNVAVSVGDDPDNVRRNLELIRRSLGLEALASVQQIHGCDIVLADHHLPADPLTPLARADGLMTDRAGVGLVIKLADCQGIILVDPVRRAVAALHAGWRGLRDGVVEAGVAAMRQNFGSRPSDLIAGVSPSLGPCCSEFVNYRQELPRQWLEFRQGPVHFDLWSITRAKLIVAGLAPEMIQFSGRCTKCDSQAFFSHRGQGPRTGRFAVVVGFRR